MVSQKWVEEVREAVRQKRESDYQRDAAFLAKREMVKEQGPLLWKKLCDAAQLHCDAYNKAEGTKTADFQMSDDMFSIRRESSHAKLIGSNVAASNEIVFVGEGWEFYEVYAFEVITNGVGKVILRSNNGMPATPDEISAKAIKEFMIQSA